MSYYDRINHGQDNEPVQEPQPVRDAMYHEEQDLFREMYDRVDVEEVAV